MGNFAFASCPADLTKFRGRQNSGPEYEEALDWFVEFEKQGVLAVNLALLKVAKVREMRGSMSWRLPLKIM